MNKGVKFAAKLWCYIGGRVWQDNLSTELIKNLKADKGLMLEASAFRLNMVANLHFQLN